MRKTARNNQPEKERTTIHKERQRECGKRRLGVGFRSISKKAERRKLLKGQIVRLEVRLSFRKVERKQKGFSL